MGGSRAAKLFWLILVIVFADVVILSPGIMGVSLTGGGALESAAAAAVIAVSALAFLFGGWSILTGRRPAAPQLPARALNSHADYVDAFNDYRRLRPLRNEISVAIDQLARIEKKKEAMNDLLGQRFQPEELSYKKFASVIAEVEQLFYRNLQSMLNQLRVFEVSGLSAAAEGPRQAAPFSARVAQEKSRMLGDYMNRIAGTLSANEEILLKLNQLMLEINELGSADVQSIEEMPGMKELDALIRQTKLYRQ